MDFFGAFLGEVFSILAFLIICAGVYKLFQLSSDMREIKSLLADIKRNTGSLGAVTPATQSRPATSSPITPEDLVRAVHEGNYSTYDDPAPLQPTVIEPKN